MSMHVYSDTESPLIPEIPYSIVTSLAFSLKLLISFISRPLLFLALSLRFSHSHRLITHRLSLLMSTNEGPSSDTSTMPNRNLVMKRIRRKFPNVTDKSSGRESNSKPVEEPPPSISSKCDPKDNVTLDQFGKRKGDDGYYFECVVCDLGGNLLCCESCPRTYHHQCLDPPLKGSGNAQNVVKKVHL